MRDKPVRREALSTSASRPPPDLSAFPCIVLCMLAGGSAQHTFFNTVLVVALIVIKAILLVPKSTLISGADYLTRCIGQVSVSP